jgi:hypothetical protein
MEEVLKAFPHRHLTFSTPKILRRCFLEACPRPDRGIENFSPIRAALPGIPWRCFCFGPLQNTRLLPAPSLPSRPSAFPQLKPSPPRPLHRWHFPWYRVVQGIPAMGHGTPEKDLSTQSPRDVSCTEVGGFLPQKTPTEGRFTCGYPLEIPVILRERICVADTTEEGRSRRPLMAWIFFLLQTRLPQEFSQAIFCGRINRPVLHILLH